MKIVLDKSRCTGLGICESLAPEHFEIDEDGELLVLQQDVNSESLEEVEAAIAACPTEALRLQP